MSSVGRVGVATGWKRDPIEGVGSGVAMSSSNRLSGVGSVVATGSSDGSSGVVSVVATGSSGSSSDAGSAVSIRREVVAGLSVGDSVKALGAAPEFKC